MRGDSVVGFWWNVVVFEGRFLRDKHGAYRRGVYCGKEIIIKKENCR